MCILCTARADNMMRSPGCLDMAAFAGTPPPAIASPDAQPLVMPLTGDQRIDGLLWGWQWNTTRLTVRFPQTDAEFYPQSFGGPGYQFIENFQPFTSFQADQIVNFGLNNLGVFTQITFSPDQNFGGGNLRFAQASRIAYEQGHVLAQLHVPGGRGSAEANPPDPYQITASAMGDNWFTLGAYLDPVLGSFQYAAGLLHELGHSLGLKHGHEANQTTFDGTRTIALPALPADMDSQEFSVMTYRSYVGHDISGGASGREEYPWTYMQLDYLALQHMYGSNHGRGSNDGDTTYSFDPVTGQMTIDEVGGSAPFHQTFSEPYNGKILLTVWDGNGTDTYDFSNYATDQGIDLRPGAFSTFSPAQLSNLSLGQAGNPVNLARGNIANALLYRDDLRALIENVTTGSGADTIIGNQTGNTVSSGAGDDVIRTLQGDDRVLADAGNDRAFGAAGADTLLGQAGNDVLKAGADDDRLVGDSGDDILQGAGGADLAFGGDGADRLDGQQGDDTLRGGAGNDRIFGGNEDDRAFGEDGDDRIAAGAGRDIVDGGPGDDVLLGGREGDTITGGPGADIFRFGRNDGGAKAADRDGVTDFSRAEGDRIHLAAIDGDWDSAGFQTLTFIGRDLAFTDVGQVRFNGNGGFLEINTAGGTTPEIRIELQGVSNIGLVDLIL
ncbi:MAG: hypothetical protein D6686_00070 [Alphaproteobacteria bacterium]|nr:MAG: hypothetical protein D6686_00070 [Alphaproteobacteria bacterium]